MKKISVAVLTAVLVITSLFCLSGCEEEKPLRLHIRANSNTDADQNVKLAVRDEIIEYITPLLVEADSVAEAKEIISSKTKEIVGIADGVLEKNGFSYRAKMELKNEYFPTRSYGDITLEGGYYDGVIISLGNGEGNNWWCVAYPPLCFGEEKIYRSKILEIIEKWRKSEYENK